MNKFLSLNAPTPKYVAAHGSVRALLLTLLISVCSALPMRASFWSSSTTPGTLAVTNDSSAVTLGLKFYADVPGTVTAIRFYKGNSNTGTHIGTLWSSTGSQLATVTFSGETTSGWQQATLSSPVSITANTVYTVSYFAPKGSYADDINYAWTRVSASPLHVSGTAPGTFAYGTTAKYPNQSWQGSNYYVDLVFTPSGSSGGTTSYSISGKISGTTATVNLSGAASNSVKTDSAGNYTFAGLANGKYLVAPSQSGYSFSPTTAVATVSNANITGVNFAGTKSVAHTVTLTWSASASANVTGYRVYRAGVSGGPYALISSSLVSGTNYTDTNVSGGDTYYYVTTSVNSSGVESSYSNMATAAVPAP